MSRRYIYFGSFASATWFSDDFGMPAAAYSLRKLTPNTTNCIRVRRSSDNTEQDIGFVANVPNSPIDTATLLAFVGAGNGFVTTWYDQSTSAINANQTSAGNQPQIVSSGVVELCSSLPSIKWDGSNDFLLINGVFTTTTNITSYLVTQSANVTLNQFLYDNSNDASFGGGYSFRFLNTGGFRAWCERANGVSGGATSNNTPYIISQLGRTTSGTTQNDNLWINNVNTANSTQVIVSRNAKTTTRIGASELFGLPLNGKISELIAYSSFESTNRAAATTNINTYYNVF